MDTRYEEMKQSVEHYLRELPLLANAEAIQTEASTVPPDADTIPQPLRSAMRYSLMLSGKRLRPVLLLMAYSLCKQDWSSVLPFAAALEMIHTYSLIHDDLPALDNDDLRRGKPSNHVVFGENMAILAGDGLLQLAYETMLEAPFTQEHPLSSVRAIREIAYRAGVRGMIAGQTLDVKLEGSAPNAELVRYIHLHKTADLLTAPMVAGLILADADEQQIQAGARYGQALGLAFQMTDDLLDLHGDVKLMGKQAGMDAQRGKMTWPAVHGEEQTLAAAQECVNHAIDALNCFGAAANELRSIAKQTLVRVH